MTKPILITILIAITTLEAIIWIYFLNLQRKQETADKWIKNIVVFLGVTFVVLILLIRYLLLS